jgi:four helix bundle protein
MTRRFEVLAVALEAVTALRPVVEKIRQADKDLAGQIRRAASSMPMCIAEGAERAGGDRSHLYRVAAGSAAEVRTALAIALAWGYVESAKVIAVEELLDRVTAMLWRLTHARCPRP